jgi:hypothetical protein
MTTLYLELNPCCFQMDVNCFQTFFEVVREGRIFDNLFKFKPRLVVVTTIILLAQKINNFIFVIR